MSGVVSVVVNVDVDRVLDRLNETQILMLVLSQPPKARGKIAAALLTRDVKDDLYIRRAHEALMGGRPSEALAYLETHLFPHVAVAA